MKPHTVFCSAILWVLLLTNCAGYQEIIVQGDGNIVTNEIPLPAFNRIKIDGGAITVNYTQGKNKESLTVTADQNILSLYTIEVKNGTLQIQPKKEARNKTLRPTEFIVETSSEHLEYIQSIGFPTFNLYSPLQTDELLVEVRGNGNINLEQPVEYKKMMIKISGNGKLNTNRLNGTELFVHISGSGRSNLVGNNDRTELKVSGSGQFHIMELTGKELFCSISGSGGAYLAGHIERTDLTISGSGFIRGADLKTDHTKCRISGSGTMEINATHNLEVQISGSGSIRYKGDPSYIDQKISGSGKISKIED